MSMAFCSPGSGARSPGDQVGRDANGLEARESHQVELSLGLNDCRLADDVLCRSDEQLRAAGARRPAEKACARDRERGNDE